MLMLMKYSIVAGTAATLIAAPAWGHHSGAMFDPDQTVVLEGTILDWQWTNPHCWLQVLVADENGRSVEWTVEFGSPAQIAYGGIRYNTFEAGARITLGINPLKSGQPGGVYTYAILADGQSLGDVLEP